MTIDALANPEIVEDGRTGFVCQKSNRIEYYTETYLPTWDTTEFLREIKVVDSRMINEIAEKTSLLIENAALRRNMGKMGRLEVENGKFSIRQRNEKLKAMFDKATS